MLTDINVSRVLIPRDTDLVQISFPATIPCCLETPQLHTCS